MVEESPVQETRTAPAAVRKLQTYINDPQDHRPEVLGRTRSQTRALSNQNVQSSVAPSSDPSVSDRLDQESANLAANMAYDAFDLTDYSPIGKKVDHVGPEPDSYAGVRKSEFREAWMLGMLEEIEGLVANETFVESDLPPGRKALSARWLFKWKTDEHSLVTRAKCRLVARGFMQEAGVDYENTFSPTPSASSIRLLTGLALKHDMELHHLDIAQAFVQAPLDEEIYMKLPPGCGTWTGKIVRLNKSLYGLNQASHAFNKLLSEKLTELGFEQSASDPCVFRLMAGSKDNRRVKMVLLCHVDDIMVGSDSGSVKWLVSKLNKSFKTNHLGELSHYSGCTFTRNKKDGTLLMHQRACIERLVDKFDVTSTSPNPSCTSASVRPKEVNEKGFDGPFRNLVGGLMWIASMTRPDIANAVRAVARHAHAPTERHWRAALKILEYLNGSPDLGIKFDKRRSDRLVAFADATYGGDTGDRRSVSGAVVMFVGGAVSWMSRTQRCVSLSSSEAEYIAMAEATKDALFLRQLLGFMWPECREQKVIMYEDNEGALRLASNPLSSNRTKHIDVRYHFIRDEVKRGSIMVLHVKSEGQHADALTKPLAIEVFRKHRDFMCGS